MQLLMQPTRRQQQHVHGSSVLLRSHYNPHVCPASESGSPFNHQKKWRLPALFYVCGVHLLACPSSVCNASLTVCILTNTSMNGTYTRRALV
jgi:hypothetical protein